MQSELLQFPVTPGTSTPSPSPTPAVPGRSALVQLQAAALEEMAAAAVRFSAHNWVMNPHEPLFNRAVLEATVRGARITAFAAGDALTAPMDFDLHEIQALLMVPLEVDPWEQPDHSRQVLLAAAARFHDILDRRPELAQPGQQLLLNPRVPLEQARRGEVTTNLLHGAVMAGLPLFPERLEEQARHPGIRAALDELAQRQGDDSVLGPRGAFSNTVSGSARIRGVAALVRAGVRFPPEPDMLLALARICGTAAAVRTHMHEDTLALLSAVQRQQQQRGELVTWCLSPGQIKEYNDLAWSSSKTSHPVLAALYQMFSSSATSDPARVGTVANFPGEPAQRIADGLNALLEPEYRLSLQDLDAVELLKITALCAQASNNRGVESYFTNTSPAAGMEMPNTADAMLLWAAAHTGGQHAQPRQRLARFGEIEPRLTEVIGSVRTAALRCVVTENALKSAINAVTSAANELDSQPSAGPGPRRRRLGM